MLESYLNQKKLLWAIENWLSVYRNVSVNEFNSGR